MNKNINKKLCQEKGLVENENYNLYRKLEAFYKYLFDRYLLSKIDLKKYDDALKNSNLDFGLPDLDKQKLNDRFLDYLNLNYIVVLNDFFIEKLDSSYIGLLKERLDKGNTNLDETLYKMIESTFKDVIKNNYHNDKYEESLYLVCYGEPIPSNFVDNDALVIKLFFAKNQKEYDKDSFIKNIVEKKKYLKTFNNELKKEVFDKVGINCDIIVKKVFN